MSAWIGNNNPVGTFVFKGDNPHWLHEDCSSGNPWSSNDMRTLGCSVHQIHTVEIFHQNHSEFLYDNGDHWQSLENKKKICLTHLRGNNLKICTSNHAIAAVTQGSDLALATLNKRRSRTLRDYLIWLTPPNRETNNEFTVFYTAL